MRFYDRIHALHRAWRYRLRTERHELRYMLGCSFPLGGSVLDVGANRGIYSYWMHKHFSTARHVVAFEPQAELVAHLEELKAAFRLERLLIAPVALSSASGSRVLRRPQRHWGGATFDDRTTFQDSVEAIPVAVTTLDDYLACRPDLRPVRFIKCDVQNHEADVLKGAANVLQEDQPELLLEWADNDESRREALFDLLTSLNYRSYRFIDGALRPEKSAMRHRGPTNWENYLFLPASRSLHAA